MQKSKDRILTPEERQIDTKLLHTYEKHVYSFTKDEEIRLKDLHQLQDFLKTVYELKSNAIIQTALQRVNQSFHPEHPVIYDLTGNVFILYTPKSAQQAP